MGTPVRPELSKKNRYWIDRHRYHELKHFCMQYPLWKQLYLSFDGLSKQNTYTVFTSPDGTHGDPTAKCVESKSYFFERMQMVEQAAIEADAILSTYILEGVTKGISYDLMKARLEIPCCKDVYYEAYRRFFWLLSKARK